jgi:hypothetical protein
MRGPGPKWLERHGTSSSKQGTNVQAKRLIAPHGQPWEIFMADNSGGIGVMGVIVGALIVIAVGGGILYATGTIGSKSTTVKLELPKITTGVK